VFPWRKAVDRLFHAAWLLTTRKHTVLGSIIEESSLFFVEKL